MKLYTVEEIKAISNIELTMIYRSLFKSGYNADSELMFKLNKERIEEEMIERFVANFS